MTEKNQLGPVGAHELKAHARDKEASRRLWDLSEKMTQISGDF